jgi:hypothetical protein
MSRKITLLNGEEWVVNELVDNMTNDEFYYEYLGIDKCLSSSSTKLLYPNPKRFLLSRGKKERASLEMKLGNVLHTKILEPSKFEERFQVVDASTRNTNIYKEAEASTDKICILEKEEQSMNYCVDAVWSCNEAIELLSTPMKEVPNIITYRGVPFRMKADAINIKKGTVVDVKTTSNVNEFRHSAYTYNYDVQAFLYTIGFDVPNMTFLVVDKTNYTVGIGIADAEFIERGKRKIDEAVDNYLRFFDALATDDVNDYYVNIEL